MFDPRTTISKEKLIDQVIDAYEHLYDLVNLRSNPLTELLFPTPAHSRKESAWEIHNLLINLIGELKPLPNAPINSREWRRYNLMILRYIDGLEVKQVVENIAIGKRQYYRERKGIMENIAEIIWSRYLNEKPLAIVSSDTAHSSDMLNRMEILRLESARIAQERRFANIEEVVQGTCIFLKNLLIQHGHTIKMDFPIETPIINIDRILFKQLLLGVLAYIINHTEKSTILISTRVKESMVCLSMEMELHKPIYSVSEEQNPLFTFIEIAELCGVNIYPMTKDVSIFGFEVQIPNYQERTILVVDDNKDIHELFRRYLIPNNYHITTAENAQEALSLANKLHPFAITLDIMMPDQDGWDLLQNLLNQSATNQIPIIVCSVLSQKELALSLGASAFLQKPVDEETLISTLRKLENR